MSDKNQKLKVDITGFQQVLKDLKRITGESYETIMKSQTRIILEKAARGTKQAKIKDIVSKNMPLGTKFPRYSATGNSLMTKHNGKLYWMKNKIPEAIWFPILERAKETTGRKIKHRGISKGQFAAWAKNLTKKSLSCRRLDEHELAIYYGICSYKRSVSGQRIR